MKALPTPTAPSRITLPRLIFCQRTLLWLALQSKQYLASDFAHLGQFIMGRAQQPAYLDQAQLGFGYGNLGVALHLHNRPYP